MRILLNLPITPVRAVLRLNMLRPLGPAHCTCCIVMCKIHRVHVGECSDPDLSVIIDIYVTLLWNFSRHSQFWICFL